MLDICLTDLMKMGSESFLFNMVKSAMCVWLEAKKYYKIIKNKKNDIFLKIKDRKK